MTRRDPPAARTRRAAHDGTPGRFGDRFVYAGLVRDETAGRIECAYELGGRRFVEIVSVGAGWNWNPAAREAARLVYLLAGVSYFKTGAPTVVDLAATPLRSGERDFLRTFYLEGLGEFAHRNGIDLAGLEIVGGADEPDPSGSADLPVTGPSIDTATRALVPFGGGMDSIVTVELVRSRLSAPALFVVSSDAGRYAALERAAAATGLPVLRATRRLDPQVLASEEHGFLNGHVPVTGIVSALAVLLAALDRREVVVMSNERSASAATLEIGGRRLNHQWSKGLEFEESFATVVRRATGGAIDYFSLLRPFSELWVAQRLSKLPDYLPVFRSCNRAFLLDPALRLANWCGECDKCCFVDLVLAPFLPVGELRRLFGGTEPLDDPARAGQFETLVGVGDEPRPWECVGDVEECAAALVLAADRSDRAGHRLLGRLVDRLGPHVDAARAAAAAFSSPAGPHHIPDALLPTPSLR